MVHFLLLLLLPEYLAEHVCFNISNGDIHVTLTDTNIFDLGFYDVKCEVNGQSCVFQCTFSNMTWFSGSSGCLDSEVISLSDKIIYNIQSYSICTRYLCKESSILPLIWSLYSNTTLQKEIGQLLYIRDSCVQLFSRNRQVKKDFIRVEKQIICNIMEKSQFESKNSIKYNLEALSLNVVNISDAELIFAKIRIQIEAPQLWPENESYVPETWLPVSALQTIQQKKRIIGLVTYMWSNQFQFDQESISSMVMRIELLGEQHFNNLNPSIQIIFNIPTHRQLDNDSSLLCHYFDEDAFRWKTDGCETTNSNQTYIICNCNHATPFAVLLIRTSSIAKVHWKILSYLSYIGCSLSAFFTALTPIIYIYSRNHRMEYSISIHISLSGALFLLNVSFLLTEWGATLEPGWVCVFFAAFMHYSLLCCLTWMAIEALHLYLLLIKVFNTYYKHYLVKLSLAGWGIPAVIVAVSVGVQDVKQFYGVTQMTMSDTNQTNAICWIVDDSFFYSLNLVYFTLIFTFNSGILITVASRICKMKQCNSKLGSSVIEPERFGEFFRSVLTVLGLTCLLGTTWGLAFLGSGYINYPILYLFCILNSAQGFFIFLWVCQSVKKHMKNNKDRITSTPMKMAAVKSD